MPLSSEGASTVYPETLVFMFVLNQENTPKEEESQFTLKSIEQIDA